MLTAPRIIILTAFGFMLGFVLYLAITLFQLNEALYECDVNGVVERSCVIDHM